MHNTMMVMDSYMKYFTFGFYFLLLSLNAQSQTASTYTSVQSPSGCAAFTSRKLQEMSIQFSGECKGGFIHGKGTLKLFSKGALVYTAEGQFSEGFGNGHGSVLDVDGAKTIGNYAKGLLNGKAISLRPNGDKFFGNYINGKMNGHFTVNYADGDKFIGEYKDNLKHGQGTYTFSDGTKFTGEYRDGEPEGQGSLISKNGSLIYEGLWEKGEMKNANKIIKK